MLMSLIDPTLETDDPEVLLRRMKTTSLKLLGCSTTQSSDAWKGLKVQLIWMVFWIEIWLRTKNILKIFAVNNK